MSLPMALTVNSEELRDLAGFRAASGIAISFYLDLAPGATPTAGDQAARVNALLAHAGKHLDAGLTHDQRKSLRADIDRVDRFLTVDLDRGGAHGLALFASQLDELWRPMLLSESVADTVRVDSELLLTPLVPLLGRGEGALVAVVGRERGELFRLRDGRLREIADRTEDQPGRHDQGGWSQARYQRHIEHLVHEHLHRVADELGRRVRGGSERIVVVSTEETRAAFEDLLSKDVLGSIIGWTTAEAHAGPAELLEVATPILREWHASEEQRVLERWREETGRSGRAAAGWEATLAAVSDARVALLLFRNGVGREAWTCPRCGRVSTVAGACPLDGAAMEAGDGLDLAVRRTLSSAGSVWAVSAPDLDPVEGIGALLRF